MCSFVTVSRVLCAALLVVAAVWSNLPVRHRVARKRVADGAGAAYAQIPEVGQCAEISRSPLPEPVATNLIVSLPIQRETDGVRTAESEQELLKNLFVCGPVCAVHNDTLQKFIDTISVEDRVAYVELVSCDREMLADDVLKDIDARGYRPATLRELLVFLETHPEEPGSHGVIPLGSILHFPNGPRGDLLVYLRQLSGEREFTCWWADAPWGSSTKFAVVRK